MAERSLLDELDEAEWCRCGKTHEECAEDGGCKWTRAEDRAATAIRLLESALHLRMHGERAPGGTETWDRWDRDAEAFLRSRQGSETAP
jgi:hypothetical protein